MVLCVASLSSCRFFAKGGAKLIGKVTNDMVNDAAQMYDIDEEIVEEYNDFASKIVPSIQYSSRVSRSSSSRLPYQYRN